MEVLLPRTTVFIGETLYFYVIIRDNEAQIDHIDVRFYGRVRFDANWINLHSLHTKKIVEDGDGEVESKEYGIGLSNFIWSPLSALTRSNHKSQQETKQKENERIIMCTKPLLITSDISPHSHVEYICSINIPSKFNDNVVPASLQVTGVNVKYWLTVTTHCIPIKDDGHSTLEEKVVNLNFTVVNPMGAQQVDLDFPLFSRDKNQHTLGFTCKKVSPIFEKKEKDTTQLAPKNEISKQYRNKDSSMSTSLSHTSAYSLEMIKFKELTIKEKERESIKSKKDVTGQQESFIIPSNEKIDNHTIHSHPSWEDELKRRSEYRMKHHSIVLSEHEADITRKAVLERYKELSQSESFNIKKGDKFIAQVNMEKGAHRMGDNIKGTICFEKAIMPCYQISIFLQTIDTLHKDVLQSSRVHSNIIRNIHASHHEYTYNTLLTHFILAIPEGCSQEFTSNIVDVAWNLRFEFIVGTSWSGPNRGQLNAKMVIWDMPLRVLYLSHPKTLTMNSENKICIDL